MGLDMYLYRRTKDGGKEEEIYWRKANAIHRYFTHDWEERGFEDDNFTEFSVTKQDLVELAELCEEVLDKHEDAPYLLPTQSGFFFGSLEYDDWYFKVIRFTRDEVNRLLNDSTDEDEFFYYAWY